MDNWFDTFMDNAIDALWADPTQDPADIMIEREQELIEDTGYNMAGAAVK